MFNLAQENKNIECLIEWIEEQKALMKQFPSFDPDVDVDEDPCNGRDCNECEIGGCEMNV
jgi:hypothetical protein